MATEIISFDELSEKIESLTVGNQYRACGESLLNALNDWPTTNLEEPRVLLEELKNEINKSLTFHNLKDYSKSLRLNVTGNAWKIESITSLLEMFDLDKNSVIDTNRTLDDIIERLTKHLRLGK